MVKSLIIGAHPDDIEFGCGGTIAKMIKEGEEIWTLTLSKGEMRGDPEKRTIESKESLHFLGVDKDKIIFKNMKDTELYGNIRQLIIEIEKEINSIKPNIVITNFEKDRHQDHVAVGIATKAAARYVDTLIAYETPSSFSEFAPVLYINIEKFIEKKIQSLKIQKSQTSSHFMDEDNIRGMAMFRGLQSKLKFAEAFCVHRIVKY